MIEIKEAKLSLNVTKHINSMIMHLTDFLAVRSQIVIGKKVSVP